MTLAELVARWRSEAEALERRGCVEAARLLTSCADEAEAALAGADAEPLPLAEAAKVSGYSVAHLRRLISVGLLRDVAERGAPRVRRGDLPRKPGARLRAA